MSGHQNFLFSLGGLPLPCIFCAIKKTFEQVPKYRRWGEVKMYTRSIDDVFFFFEGIKKYLMKRLDFLQLEGLHIG